MIVIRSLVPGGVAQLDGRLVPGDRLMAVNEVNLENGTLDQAVQALKGAPRGTVRILVAKPLPLPEIGESSTDELVGRALHYILCRPSTLKCFKSLTVICKKHPTGVFMNDLRYHFAFPFLRGVYIIVSFL